MKTITVRDLRQRWPEAERALALEREIVVTRDGQPVAKLTRIASKQKKRKRFDASEQRRFRDSIFGKGVKVNWVREFCDADRGERF
jgi:antitoxin (DNA-binding transcriptional repressor) of toxin-antitoxin stability system